MRNNLTIKKYFLSVVITIASLYCNAQTPTDSLPGDPGGLYIYTTQNLAFGAISHGNTGGTVIVGSDGSRSVTGDVVALNLGVQYFNAIFDCVAKKTCTSVQSVKPVFRLLTP